MLLLGLQGTNDVDRPTQQVQGGWAEWRGEAGQECARDLSSV